MPLAGLGVICPCEKSHDHPIKLTNDAETQRANFTPMDKKMGLPLMGDRAHPSRFMVATVFDGKIIEG